MKDLRERILNCIVRPIPSALRIGLWIICITVPVAFAVFLLKFSGAIDFVAIPFEPLFSLIGLPGESALVFITSCLLNIYSCIAVMGTLNLTGHEITVLALMCLISHNLPVETAVQKKTGTSALTLIVIRLCSSFAGGLLLHHLMPSETAFKTVGSHSSSHAMTSDLMKESMIWLEGTALLCLKIFLLITVLIILQKILEEFKITAMLSGLMKYPLALLGIPAKAVFLWIISNTLGLAYGSGILIDQSQKGTLNRKELDILNYHIAISHSLLEDTLLFVAIGVSAWWISVPRLFIAGIVVWGARLIYSFRSSTRTVHESQSL